jgi:two-component system, LuxR family, response regulator FixJ
MALVAEGLVNKESALRLEISPRTVESYRAWVMEKMGASNLADLVRKAMRLGTQSGD